MSLLGEYKNGNCLISIFDDGTKIRETGENAFIPSFPESMDLKITNYCDMCCPYCHENSTVGGKHGDILKVEFINTLHPFTEVAIGGGNPLSHPDLIKFLELLRTKQIIANITVNQTHFLDNKTMLKELTEDFLIYGLGVSMTNPTDELVDALKDFPNAVLHVINGVTYPIQLEKLYNKNLKLLILGYKQLRRGDSYYSNEVEVKKRLLYDELPCLLSKFKVVSFDNLAVEQLTVKRLLSDGQWKAFYMGDDGSFTMYIDLVEGVFSESSTSNTRQPLHNDIESMFNFIRKK